MNRGPVVGSAGKNDPIARARGAWGEAMPKEVLALAEACKASTAKAVAERLGYSGAVISHVLGGTYHKGDMARFFAAVRGALMGEVVLCPILDEIGRDQCLIEQVTPFATSNPTRVQLFHACKTCPNRQQKDVA